jgi:hypothetical protein
MAARTQTYILSMLPVYKYIKEKENACHDGSNFLIQKAYTNQRCHWVLNYAPKHDFEDSKYILQADIYLYLKKKPAKTHRCARGLKTVAIRLDVNAEKIHIYYHGISESKSWPMYRFY